MLKLNMTLISGLDFEVKSLQLSSELWVEAFWYLQISNFSMYHILHTKIKDSLMLIIIVLLNNHFCLNSLRSLSQLNFALVKKEMD